MITKKTLQSQLLLLANAAAFLLLILGSCAQYENNLPEIEYIRPDEAKGIPLATVVKDVPLAFTTQIFPFDENGNTIGGSDLNGQIDQILKNMEAILQSAGSDLSGLVRIHAYLTDDGMAEKVQERLQGSLPGGVLPAITFITTGMVHPGVVVTMDVVAVSRRSEVSERVSLFSPKGVYIPENRSQVAVLAPGRKIFISGQAESGDSLSDASRKTMRNLFATLAYMGGDTDDIVQIKAFINPIEKAKLVEDAIVSCFHGRKAPPIVTVEWLQDPGRAEIELIASAPAEDTSNWSLRHYAPGWMSQATTFSRVVDIRNGGLFFTSGLYGKEGENGEAQARDIFDTLTQILQQAGSDYDHLIKATYYPSDENGRKGLVAVRTKFYNPEKPPAASLIMVRGTGRPSIGLTIDMIGLVPE